MNREFLRGLGVTEDIIPQIINQHHDTMRPLKEKADEVEALQSQVDTLNSEIKNRDDELNSVREKAKGNEELLKELDDVKKQRDQRAEENEKLQLNNAIEVEALKEGVVDTKAFLKLIDTSTVKRKEDGAFDGIKELFETSKESMPYLFASQKPKGYTPPEGGNPTLSKQDFDAMSYADKEKLYQENPEVFKQLSK
ncbi:phage scaffolding protein [Macrococcoides caseolyticum]|uniref:Uncharacterized protein n=1 Tax=Macrococcoides caseolyticum TaxID=69966 RepID=A0ACC9MV79_9STAP|nr:phage scaffolding protein [Macrococcus caseolyticus]PKE52718.1 hypothetical protein CW676_08390 [Macrococcus caseolyticus]PKE57278.1 hypothetical protein CW682_01315 [Macrococcus caseolyticus]PKF14012.1 hypothetical protein CW690_08665 [Macrococcus caseolyticus]PKF38435.1 hypothetical protein CW681_06455 [Macrococcus caseolyticus]QYA35964.1 phage scaffolding protein [Macrococcus caseolyticus]